MNTTLRALAAASAERPFARKPLVAPTLGVGREVLRALAGQGVAWIGFEPVTPWIVASGIAAGALAAKTQRVADEFEQLALLDEAMDGVLADLPGFAVEFAEGPGLRNAIADAVRELRHTGIDAALLTRTPLRDTRRRDALARILRRYEAALHRAAAVDAAGVFRVALQQLATGAVELDAADWLILPGADRRGLVGRLLDELVRRGARVLPADPVFGLETPVSQLASTGDDVSASTRLAYLHAPEAAAQAAGDDVAIDVFAAGSVPDELREVLRRIIAAGLRWDEVEIVATDAVAYGAALDGIARRLDIPVGFAAGLPVARTRPGRAIRAWLQWVREDLPADLIRAMFERGDLVADGDVSGVALARRLRRLRIGRTRERWEAALDAAERAAHAPPSAEDERSPDEAEAAKQRERAEVAALSSILRPVLDATPDVPDRLRTRDVPVRPSDLAQGLLALLRFVPPGSSVDATATTRLEKRLARIAATLVRPTTVDAAVALLEAKLDARVPAPDENGNAPWSSAGGRLHLSDLRHGGWTGRRATFIVGLDAGRFPPGGLQEAVLSDDDRRRLTTGQAVPAMATSAQRIDEARHALAALLARLRGHVTLSWSAWEAAEARTLAPAPEMLQACRIASGDVTADYGALQTAAGVASPVPRDAAACLDASDVWLEALSVGGALRDGIVEVRASYPGLDRGIAAEEARTGDAYSAWHGRIARRPALDARRESSGVVLSASRLEALGTCPLRYFMRTVLRVRPTDDVELDADRWLSPMQRGGLLHAVYEMTLAQARRTGTAYEDEAFGDIAQGALDVQIEEYRRMQPPPGGAVFRQEIEALRADVRAFVEMIRNDAPDWIGLELAFGRGGREPFTLTLDRGEVRLSGAIDRVDRLPDERLRIVDYKTGSSYRFRQGNAYHGGRRLQHVLYAAVARAMLDAEVARVEYQFPTVRELSDRVPYEGADLRDGLHVIEQLLDLAASGAFHPTDDPDDCRFCDYAAVCRASLVRGKTQSAPASWARAATGVDALVTLRQLRDR